VGRRKIMGETFYPTTPNADRVAKGRHYLGLMIFGVETRPKGFDTDGITWLVENWLKFRISIRGPGDAMTMQAMWLRKHPLHTPPQGKKRTQHLVDTVKRLNQYLTPNEQNPQAMYSILDDVQKQMYELVTDFRGQMEAMNHKDKDKFLAELRRVSSPEAYKYLSG
jgi:hypothetical protein